MLAESRLRFDSFGIYLSTFLRRTRHWSRVCLSVAIHLFVLLRYQRRKRRLNPSVRFIAVSLIEHLGDIVACEPVARYLRRLHPDASIVWLVRAQYRELIAGNPHIDVCLVVHCLTEKDFLLRAKLFDTVFDLHFPERHCALCPSWATRANRPASPAGIGLSNFYDHGNLLQAMSLSAGLPALEDEPHIYISEEVKLRVDTKHLPSYFTVIHCASNTAEKNWPRRNWEDIAHHIVSTHRCPIVEVGLDQMLAGAENGLYRNLAGELSILETGEVIRRAKLFIGIDSGPAHLANAVGTYGIVLLGSYLGFTKYNPFPGKYGNGRNASLIHTIGPLANLRVQEVIEKIDAVLKPTIHG